MLTDVNPNLPVQAYLIGGPMHGKQLNLPKEALDEGYTCVESSMYATSVPPVPANSGYNESKYRYDDRIPMRGKVHAFVHESAVVPGGHRLGKIAEQAREKIQSQEALLRDLRIERTEAEKDALEAKIEVRQLQGKMDRIVTFTNLIYTGLAEVVDATRYEEDDPT